MTTSDLTDPSAQSQPLRAEVTEVLTLPPFEQLYREQFDFVWRVLLRMGVPRRDVEDQLQEVFRVVYTQRTSYDGRGAPRSWLFGIAHNITRTYRRGIRRKGIFDVLPDNLATNETSADQSLLAREDLQRLRIILDSLDENLRDVFIMTEVLEMTAREIGESLSLSPNTVSTRLRRAWDEVERKTTAQRRTP
jgi:RNA polymerase sigma factor (sigma-70 family)